jgi:3-oxoacyl-[acyl-carrier protein] reductase
MDLELTGKVAIVGGASKGLGRACAQVLADEGAKLAPSATSSLRRSAGSVSGRASRPGATR